MEKFILGATSSAFLLPAVCSGTPLLCKVGFCAQCITSILYHYGQHYLCDHEHLKLDTRYIRDLDMWLARGLIGYTLYNFSKVWHTSYPLSLFIVAVIGFSYLLYLVDSAELYHVTHSLWHVTAGLAAILIFSKVVNTNLKFHV